MDATTTQAPPELRAINLAPINMDLGNSKVYTDVTVLDTRTDDRPRYDPSWCVYDSSTDRIALKTAVMDAEIPDGEDLSALSMDVIVGDDDGSLVAAGSVVGGSQSETWYLFHVHNTA